MIVRERPSLIQLFTILRGSVLLRIFPQVTVVLAMSSFIVVAHGFDPSLVPTFSGAPFALLGIALSIFLGFSNSACYDRWWEARKAWGNVGVSARNLARRTLLLEQRGEEAEAARVRLLHLCMAFAQMLVVHLRPQAPATHVARTVPADLKGALARAINGPEFLLRIMGGVLADLRQKQIISDIEFQIMDRDIDTLNDSLTACERLRSTPVPFGYTLLLHRTAYLFCFLLPFGFADVLGWVTPLATGLVAYTFFGLDALASELEEPFGTLPNDLPILALATNMERGLREALGEENLPPAPEPVDHILQ